MSVSRCPDCGTSRESKGGGCSRCRYTEKEINQKIEKHLTEINGNASEIKGVGFIIDNKYVQELRLMMRRLIKI